MSCQFCDDTGWEITDRGAIRCRHTKQQAKPAEPVTPITEDDVAEAVKCLGALAFFPQDHPSQIMISDALDAMCPSVESLRYVVRRAVALYRTWDKCGVPGLRQIVCARYRPADGIESGPTDLFPDGVPSERKRPDPLALPEGARKALPPGHEATADPEIDAAIQKLAARHSMPPAQPNIADRFVRMLRDLETQPHLREPEESTPPNPNYIPLTQTDLDRAIKERDERKAKEAEEKEKAKIVNIRFRDA